MNSMPTRTLPPARAASLLLLTLASLGTAAAQISFNREIRPILSDNCFACHGPDRNARMAGLRLDRRDEALKPTATGATPLVPGDPERSALIQRILAPDPARRMPPEGPQLGGEELRAVLEELVR